ncbi:MAG: hypothetical protein HRT69_17135, partial [Flavobacteriaceae bacterium]|nr:hypothetical protein [Flavobacteriaceae bacterium]
TVSTNLVDFGVYNYNLSYNADNSVITNTPITSSTGASTTTISNGNVIESNIEGGTYDITFTHDTKNAPFKNIDNRTILLSIDSENSYNYYFNTNNILTHIEDYVSDPWDITNSYTYTEFHYPRVITENFNGDISTYTYTYNND